MSERTAAIELDLADEPATQRLGAAMARCIAPGMKLYLEGDLGAGKTTFVRAMLRALGEKAAVKSPTYALVELYELSSLNLYHFDFYRFTRGDAWVDAGFAAYFDDPNVCFVEWPERAAGLPIPDWRVSLTFGKNVGRHVSLRAETERGRPWLEELARALAATT